MSHDTGVDGDSKGIDTGSGDDGSSLGRRGFLKAAGVATAGALLSTASQAVAASSHPKGIIFDGSGTSATSEYAFTASDSVEQLYDSDDNDVTIDGGSASGSIGDSIVAFGYAETLTELDMTGPASILLGPEIENELPEPAHELVITAEGEISYEFTTTGEITKLLDNGRNSAEENNDTVTQNDDGTWTAVGYTGNGYGDGFTYRGDVTEFTPQTGAFELYRDGESTDAYELTGTEPPSGKELLVRSDGEISYEFTTTGKIEKLLDNGRDSAEENNDTVTQNDDGTWTAVGYTGNGYGDGFSFEGEVTEFTSNTSNYTLILDGEEVDKWTLTGEEEPQIRESVVGGGSSYEGQTFTEDDATVVVTSRGELSSALDNAEAGDVVFIPGDERIEMNGASMWIPDDVTLASDRGVDGSSGGVINESSDGNVRVFKSNNGVHMSGLRFFGPHKDQDSVNYSSTWDHAGIGLQLRGNGGEVSNCEVAGFGYDAIRSEGENHIHHSVIRNNPMSGLGYGVQVFSGSDETVIEYCEFEDNRHCIVGQGSAGYVARYNICREDQVHHAFDHHGSGGPTEIYNNRFEMVPGTVDIYPSAFRARECLDGPVDIHHNWCFNSNEPDPNDPGDGDAAFASKCEFQNMNIYENHYGTSTPPAGVGLDLN